MNRATILDLGNVAVETKGASKGCAFERVYNTVPPAGNTFICNSVTNGEWNNVTCNNQCP